MWGGLLLDVHDGRGLCLGHGRYKGRMRGFRSESRYWFSNFFFFFLLIVEILYIESTDTKPQNKITTTKIQERQTKTRPTQNRGKNKES